MQKLEPGFLNSWGYFNDTKSSHVYLDTIGPAHVWITGLIAGGTINNVAFYMPQWAWPDKEYRLAVVTNSGHGWLSIHADGRVIPVAGGTTYFELAGMWRKALSP